MQSLNKISLIGRIGQDSILRYTTDNIPVANFSIAVDDSFKDSNGVKQESVQWFNIVAWRHLGEIAGEYLKKGQLIYVEGKLKIKSYEDKNGQPISGIDIIADNFIILSNKDKSEESNFTTTSKPLQ